MAARSFLMQKTNVESGKIFFDIVGLADVAWKAKMLLTGIRILTEYRIMYKDMEKSRISLK